ncbi:hypothetical protein [Halocalculus aciditolerans]|uniref:Rpa-associated protein n=1 Tax=Halocalculus aciditolerans TaxID=1383812 RepID=A0A830FK13_9EURY|nr:hypothetical protein [Halocalculus aciditolerans]GGL54260.1 hypothetical protein GCM10009039_10530 [Halocalculus aciditolerans]
MSSNGNDNDVIPSREVAWRVFASEFDDADFSYAESDEERAPNYVVTPSGARINRLFVVGVLTEVEDVNEDVVRARIVDPTGAFVVYAGQYQPDALASLESAETPSFVALSGKARTFEPDDADVVYTSIRPESVNEVDADTRDRWVVRTAEQTLDRVNTMAAALDRPERGDDLASVLEDGGVPPALASGTALAIDHYGTTEHYLAGLRDLALDAARVVTGEKSEVDGFDRAPDTDGDGTVEPATLDVDAATADEPLDAESEREEPEPGPDAPGEEPVAEGPTARALDDDEPEPEESDLEPEPADAEPEPEPLDTTEAEAESESEPDAEVEPDSEAEAEAESEVGSGQADTSEVTEDVDAIETDEMQGLTEEEREEVEENFDVGFSTGSDIPDQGEADIETPEPEDVEDLEAAEEPGEGPLGDFEDASEEDEDDLDDFTEAEYDEPESDAEDEAAGKIDGDLEDVVIDEMQALDDGDGADRDELVRTLVESSDAGEDEIEDAIQSALMSGRCYESGEDHLKAI